MVIRNILLFSFFLIIFSTSLYAYGFGFTPNFIEFDITNNKTFSQFIVYNSNNFPVILKPINDQYLTLVDTQTLEPSSNFNLTIKANSKKVFLLKQTKPTKKDINSQLELFLCRLDNCESGSVFGFILKYNLNAKKSYFDKNEILVLGGNNRLKITTKKNPNSNIFNLGGGIISILIIGGGLFLYRKNKQNFSKIFTLFK